MLVAVDDLQWLDPPTALVLEFVARRLAAEPVGLLLAERAAGDGDPPLGLGRSDLELVRVRLGPLSTGALHRLLRRRLDVALPRPALHRVHAASGGNPFYALELVRALQSRRGRIQPGRPLPVPETLEAILRERLEVLPLRARKVLAAAAALARPTEAILEDSLALEQAFEAGIIELSDGDVRFSHPLLASAAYTSIPAADRRRLHRHLAEVVSDSEERARHLALGAEEPNEEVADALDDAAREAAARGAPAAAAELVELAIRLTPVKARESFGSAESRRPDTTFPPEISRRVQPSSSLSPRRCRPARRARMRCCFSRARNKASSGRSNSRNVRSSMLATTTLVSPRSSVTSERSPIVQGQPEQALDRARAGLASAERAGEDGVLARALATVAWFETLTAVEPTPGLLERAVSHEDARLQAEVSDSTSPSFALSMRLMLAGRLDQARAACG